MQPRREDRSAAQAVEIVVALAAGVLAFVAVILVSWLIAAAVGAGEAVWGKPALVVGCLLGGAATLWRLFRARRFGL
jgi:hypothetical protein